MAEIPTFNDPVAPALAGNVGTDALISAARRVGPLAREGAQAVDQGAAALGSAVNSVFKQREAVKSRQEIASGVESYALVHNQQSQQLNQQLAQAKPADYDQVIGDFKANVLDPQASDFSNSFQTQAGKEWAQLHSAEQNARLLGDTHELTNSLAGNQALVSIDNAKNTLASNALNDPMAIDRSLAAFSSGVNGIAGTMSDPKQASELSTKLLQHGQSEIAYAGVHGAIEAAADPVATGAALSEKYKQYLTPEQQTVLHGYGDVVGKARVAQQRLDNTMSRQDDKDSFDKAANSVFMSMYDPQSGRMAKPDDFYQNMVRLSAMPGAREDPSMVGELLRLGNTAVIEAARGTPTTTDRPTYQDFANRQFLGEDDPQHLTIQDVAKARADGMLSDKDAQMFRQNLDDFSKNPAMAADQKSLDTFLKSGPNTLEGSNPQNIYTFQQEKTAQFWAGRNAGLPASDLLDPKSKNFLGFATQDQLGSAAVAPAQAASPSNVYQKKLSDAVDTAMTITNLAKNNAPEAVNSILKNGGIDIDTSRAWCAPLVNAALKEAGLDPSANGTAASFKNWGFPVDAGQVRKGDVFYMPAEGYTGHVGFATGQTRSGPGGQLQVQVVSSHLQGSADNGGGVEWRDARSMVFRRAKPPLADIKPSTSGGIFNWLTKTDASQTTAPGQE